MKQHDNNHTNNPWTVINDQTVYENNWIKVTHYNVLNPVGKEGIYGKVSFKNKAIAILPIDENGQTFLVGQYRFTLQQYSWEVPEGGCPFNEQPIEAAKRELLEETGLVAQHWQLVQEVHLSNSVSDEVGYIFIATQLSQQLSQPEETEQLQILKMPISQAIQWVHEGKITDSLSVIALLKAENAINNQTLTW